MNEFVILFLACILAIGVGIYIREDEQCRVDAKMMNTIYKYSFNHGCYIKKGDKYIPRDLIKE